MKSVFIVDHSYQLNDDAFSEETKLIGIYSTKRNAEEAIERSKLLPGFKQFPDYFTADEYVLDEDNWTSGFFTEKNQPIFSVWNKDSNGEVHLVKERLVEADALRLVRELHRKDGTQEFYAKEHA